MTETPVVTAEIAERRLSAEARPTGSTLGMFAEHVRAEIRQHLRMPEYAIGILAMPAILYAMFGMPSAGEQLDGGTSIGALMFGSIAGFNLVTESLFTFGVGVAYERRLGWVRRLRATPMPMWVYLAGKIVMAVLFSAAVLALLLVLAVAGGVRFDITDLVRTVLVLLAGTVLFAPMGWALAYWVRPKAATTVANVVFLPLSFASGFFMPLDALPGFVQTIAPYLPTYHFGQLVWGQLAPAADIAQFGMTPPGPWLVDLAWVVGFSVVLAALAVAGYRRDRRRTIGR